MPSRVFALVALLTLPLLAGAQELLPVTSAPDGLSATLAAPRTASGPVDLTLTLKSALPRPVGLAVGRGSSQNCALAPSVRVLRVGTREVVYPVAGAEPRLCAQDIVTRTLPQGGQVTFTRALDLAPGEYMIEGWYAGLAEDQRVKLPAPPVRVTVR